MVDSKRRTKEHTKTGEMDKEGKRGGENERLIMYRERKKKEKE